MDAPDLELHRVAQLLVERGQRLVEEQHVGLEHERAGERDPLLLAAGERAHGAVAGAGELHELEHLAHAPLALGARRPCARASG